MYMVHINAVDENASAGHSWYGTIATIVVMLRMGHGCHNKYAIWIGVGGSCPATLRQ